MKRILITFFLLVQGTAFAQNFSYPSIKNKGKNINHFIPDGWTLLDSTQGDLNNDNHNDLVLIIQHIDHVRITKKDFDYIETVLTQPRILIILFYNKTANQYQLAEQSNSFILDHDNPSMEEPYQDISIYKGVLKIDFQIFMNMGSWGMSNNFYKFRYQGNQFVLIGADYNSLNRASGEIEYRSYNFLTKKVKVTTGMSEEDEQKTIWRAIKLKELKTIKTFKKPFTWEVEKGYYL